VNRVAAILFGLLLVWAQNVFPARAAGPAQVKHCACCGCQTTDCCAKAPAPTSPPVAPAQNAPQVSSQLLLAVPAQLALTASATGANEFVPSRLSTSFGTTAVPLYRRNCSFLI